MKIQASLAVAALGLSAVLVGTPVAASATPAAPVASGGFFPDSFALPTGFRPEGITIGRAPFAYLGSLADGSIYRANLLTGRGEIISEGPGTQSVGLKLDDRGRLFVAGGATGDARVVDARSGAVLASYTLAAAPTFINDVVLTPDAAWFTDSQNAVLYGLPLGRHGRLPAADAVVRLPLTGDWQQVTGFNANGIARTPDGSAVLVVQSATGFLFRVDPRTGVATRVDLGGALLPSGDGLLTIGRTLYVVQNQLNQVAVFHLNRAGSSGSLVKTLTDEDFDVPTTVAAFGKRLYLPNARFGIADPDNAEFSVNAVRR